MSAAATAITQDIRVITDKYDEVVKTPEAESPKHSLVLDLDQLARVERLPAAPYQRAVRSSSAHPLEIYHSSRCKAEVTQH
jgi:hypothetical protein